MERQTFHIICSSMITDINVNIVHRAMVQISVPANCSQYQIFFRNTLEKKIGKSEKGVTFSLPMMEEGMLMCNQSYYRFIFLWSYDFSHQIPVEIAVFSLRRRTRSCVQKGSDSSSSSLTLSNYAFLTSNVVQGYGFTVNERKDVFLFFIRFQYRRRG